MYVDYWKIPEIETSENSPSYEISLLVKQHIISYIETQLRYYTSLMIGKQ